MDTFAKKINMGWLESQELSGYELLAQKIFEQAVKDYYRGLNTGNARIVAECEKFFYSEWFALLKPNVVPEYIIRGLRQKCNATGKQFLTKGMRSMEAKEELERFLEENELTLRRFAYYAHVKYSQAVYWRDPYTVLGDRSLAALRGAISRADDICRTVRERLLKR